MLLTAQEVYEERSTCNKENLQNAVNSILKKINKTSKHSNKIYIVDGTPTDVDVNLKSKKITKKSLEGKDYKWS